MRQSPITTHTEPAPRAGEQAVHGLARELPAASGRHRYLARPPVTDLSPRSAFQGVRWTVAFAALLGFLFVIVSYQIRIGTALMAVAIVGLLLERSRIRLPSFLVLFGLFVVWAWLGWDGSSDVYDELIVMGKAWLIGIVVVSTLTDRRRLRLFVLAFLLFFALYPARGALFNYFLVGYSNRGRALWNFIYANPNDLAALALLQLSMAAALLATEPKGVYRKGAMAAAVVLPVLILLTQSRGAFIGLLAFGLLALSGGRRRARALAMLAVVGLSAMMVVPNSAWERFGMLKSIARSGTESLATLEDLGSAEQRWQIWQASFRIISDHPLAGVGLGAYGRVQAVYSPELGRADTHSTYLNLAAEVGFPGLLLFLGVVALPLIHAERVRRRIKQVRPRSAEHLYLLELGLLGFLVAGIFASYARLTFLYLHLVILWSSAEVYRRDLQAVESPARSRRRAT